MTSTIDLYRQDFVLLAGPNAGRWAKAGRRVTAPVRLNVFQVGHDLHDLTGAWAAAHGVTDSGAVLVRPDGFVCWRARDDVCAGDPADRLGGVLRCVLGHRRPEYERLPSA